MPAQDKPEKETGTSLHSSAASSCSVGKQEEQKESTQAHQEAAPQGRRIELSDIIKFAGLIAFFLIMALVCYLLWPYFHELFEPGGLTQIMNDVKSAGSVGVLILLGLQFLQIVVAFIPGEVTQMAAGLLYGPWLGALIILLGCVLSSAFIYVIVKRLGAPFVQNMVPVKYLEKFRSFEESGKLNIIVFVLFLIPGLPKDVFTYLVPLTDMRMRNFLVLANAGRIPGILVTTYAANSLAEGRFMKSAVIFGVAAILAIVGVLLRDRVMNLFSSRGQDKHKAKAKTEAKTKAPVSDEEGSSNQSEVFEACGDACEKTSQDTREAPSAAAKEVG